MSGGDVAEGFDLPGLTGQLANVIRLLEVGFARTDGRLDVITMKLEQAERRHDDLAATEAEHHRQVMEILDEHDQRITAATTALAQEKTRAETQVAGAKRIATWVALGVSVLGVLLGNLDKILPG